MLSMVLVFVAVFGGAAVLAVVGVVVTVVDIAVVVLTLVVD